MLCLGLLSVLFLLSDFLHDLLLLLISHILLRKDGITVSLSLVCDLLLLALELILEFLHFSGVFLSRDAGTSGIATYHAMGGELGGDFTRIGSISKGF